MERALIAAVVVGVAAVVALIAQRRAPDPPTQPAGAMPAQVDRDDLPHRAADRLVVLFSSATCASCAQVRAILERLTEAGVATCEVEHSAEPALHERYGIDSVPATVIVDRDGVVEIGFLGPPPAGELERAAGVSL